MPSACAADARAPITPSCAHGWRCAARPGSPPQWHPDKHPNNQEEAKDKFQAINKAYEKLMTSDEEERVEALGHR